MRKPQVIQTVYLKDSKDVSQEDLNKLIRQRLILHQQRQTVPKSLTVYEDGWEYWLEMSKDNGLYLMKKCKTCGELKPKVVRLL